MYIKSACLLSGILFIVAAFSSAQRTKECNPESQCIFLSSCPQMSDLINSGNPSGIEIVRSSFCGYIDAKEMVCCPTTKSSEPTIDHPAESVNLLPTKCGRTSAQDKIINGSPSPLGAFPWMAALGYTKQGKNKPSFQCAGSIINSRYVLTSAVCLVKENLEKKNLSVIHLGDWDLDSERDCQQTRLGLRCSKPHIVVGVEETVTHPNYNKRSQYSDDIALIRLNVTLNFEDSSTTIEPVCLPPKDFNLKTFAGNRDPIAAGWGNTEQFGNLSNILLRANIPFADDAICREIYQKNFVENQLCIGGGEGGFDTCNGDSGGPLFMTGSQGPPFIQVGITSFGLSCGIKGSPSVYTDVAAYRDWIIKNMKP